MVGHGEDQLPDARPRHRAPHPRRAELPGVDQHRARLRPDRPAGLRLRARSPARATARAAASTARSATSSPAAATSRTPSTAPTSPSVWGVDPDGAAAGRASTAYEMFRKIDRGEIKGLLCDLLQPGGVAAGQQLRHADAREARVLRRHRLLPERDGPLRRHRAARLAARGGRGHRRADRGPGHQDQQGRRRRPAMRGRTGGSSRTSPQALGRERGFTFDSPREIFEELRRGVAGRRRRLLRHHLREDRGAERASSGRARRRRTDHPGTPRLFEPGSWNPVAKGAGPFYFPDGKARFNVDAVRAAGRGRGRRVSGDPDHRPGRQPVPVRDTRRGASARWSTSTPSRCCEMHPQLADAATASRTATG